MASVYHAIMVKSINLPFRMVSVYHTMCETLENDIGNGHSLAMSYFYQPFGNGKFIPPIYKNGDDWG